MEDSSDGFGVHMRDQAACPMDTDQSTRQFNRGDLRVMPKDKEHLKNRWCLHLDRIHDGIRSGDTFNQLVQISSCNAARLQEAGTSVQTSPIPDVDMVCKQPSEVKPQKNNVFEENSLRNMTWWNEVDVAIAIKGCTVHTWEGAHPALEAGLEEAKLAVLQMVITNTNVDSRRAWKLLLMFDRLMYARMPAKARPKDVTATQYRKSVVTDRLRRFWRGEWQSLWDESHVTARALPSEQQHGEEDLRQLAARIESLGAANEWGKAMKAVQSNAPLITDPGRIAELQSKFPKERCQALQPREADPADHEDFWSEVDQQARKLCKRLPRKAGPAWDGSRFEHWTAQSSDSEFACAVATVAVRFASGQAPDFVYQSARCGRLLALSKPDGGVRPLVITAALRRIALKAVIKVITPRAVAALGPEQFAIGRSNAAVDMLHCLQAENAAYGRAVVSLDLSNAFGSISRGMMGQDMMKEFPELATLISILLSTNTPLLWEDADGIKHEIVEQTGLDQGCPFSLLCFLFGLKRVLARMTELLGEFSGREHGSRKAYVDDVYATCATQNIPQVLKCFELAAAETGMLLNQKKTRIWGVDRESLPQELRQYHVDVLPILGNTVERSGGDSMSQTLV